MIPWMFYQMINTLFINLIPRLENEAAPMMLIIRLWILTNIKMRTGLIKLYKNHRTIIMIAHKLVRIKKNKILLGKINWHQLKIMKIMNFMIIKMMINLKIIKCYPKKHIINKLRMFYQTMTKNWINKMKIICWIETKDIQKPKKNLEIWSKS